MSAVRLGTTVIREYIQCLVSREVPGSTEEAAREEVKGKMRGRGKSESIIVKNSRKRRKKYSWLRPEEMSKARETQGDLSLESVPPFPQKFINELRLFHTDVYSECMFEPLHNFSCGMPKRLKKYFLNYIWSATLCTKEGGNVRGGKVLVRFKGNMLQSCKVLVELIKNAFPVTGFLFNFPRVKVFLKFSGLFKSDSVPGLMKRKYYQSVDLGLKVFLHSWTRLPVI